MNRARIFIAAVFHVVAALKEHRKLKTLKYIRFVSNLKRQMLHKF